MTTDHHDDFTPAPAMGPRVLEDIALDLMGVALQVVEDDISVESVFQLYAACHQTVASCADGDYDKLGDWPPA